MAETPFNKGKSYGMTSRVVFKQLAPDRLKVMIGGGWFILFGALFLLPVLPFLLMILHIVNEPGAGSGSNAEMVLGLFGLPFFIVGISAICLKCTPLSIQLSA